MPISSTKKEPVKLPIEVVSRNLQDSSIVSKTMQMNSQSNLTQAEKNAGKLKFAEAMSLAGIHLMKNSRTGGTRVYQDATKTIAVKSNYDYYKQSSTQVKRPAVASLQKQAPQKMPQGGPSFGTSHHQ
jgi:hypothetical protein